MDEAQPSDSFQEVLGRGHRNKQTAHMAAGIAQDMLGSDGSADEAVAISSAPKARRTAGGKGNKTRVLMATGNPFDPLIIEEASDVEDDDYAAKTSSSSASGTDTEIEEITNEEVFQH